MLRRKLGGEIVPAVDWGVNQTVSLEVDRPLRDRLTSWEVPVRYHRGEGNRVGVTGDSCVEADELDNLARD